MDLPTLFSVRGKFVLVTGGGRGIGKMISEGFARNGATVFISSRDAKALEASAAELNQLAGPSGGRVVALPPCDMFSLEGVRKLAADLKAALRQMRGHEALDVLVHNSGASWGESFEQFSEKGWDRVMDLNVKSVFFLTQALVDALTEGAKLSGQHASIISVGSTAGLMNQPFPTYSYDASKSAVHHLTRHFAALLAPRNITANTLAPGLVPTKMSNQLQVYTTRDEIVKVIPRGRPGEATDMAGLCIFYASKAGEWVTGQTVAVDGGQIVAGKSPSKL